MDAVVDVNGQCARYRSACAAALHSAGTGRVYTLPTTGGLPILEGANFGHPRLH